MASPTRIVLLTVPVEDADLAADVLWSAGAAAIEERPGAAALTVTLVADVAPCELRMGWSVTTTEVDDGRDVWRAHATRWRAGPFTVRPPWVTAGADGIDLVIDPGHAFGSGSHPTTRLVLAALAPLVSGATRVLDVGSGSGVLAVAAAKLGAAPVDAVDVEPAAVAATIANARANAVGVGVAPLAKLTGPYEVIVANLSAATLRALANDLEQRAAPAAALVVSGILVEQVDDVLAAFTRCALVSRAEDDGWVALRLVRSAS